MQLVGDFLRNALAASAGADGGLRQWNLLVADEQGVKLGEPPMGCAPLWRSCSYTQRCLVQPAGGRAC